MDSPRRVWTHSALHVSPFRSPRRPLVQTQRWRPASSFSYVECWIAWRSLCVWSHGALYVCPLRSPRQLLVQTTASTPMWRVRIYSPSGLGTQCSGRLAPRMPLMVRRRVHISCTSHARENKTLAAVLLTRRVVRLAWLRCARSGYPGYGGERGPRGDEEYLWGGGGGRGPAGGWAMGAPGAGPGGAEYQLWSQGRNDGYASASSILPALPPPLAPPPAATPAHTQVRLALGSLADGPDARRDPAACAEGSAASLKRAQSARCLTQCIARGFTLGTRVELCVLCEPRRARELSVGTAHST
jgi:hypothetical protein